MKLKDFKKFINEVDEKFDELEVVMPCDKHNHGLLVSDFLPFRNVILLTGDYKNNKSTSDELRFLEI